MKKIVAVIVLAFALQGCSAFVEGPYQTMRIITNPDNATCKIYDHAGDLHSSIVSGETAYDIRRDSRPLTVVCSKVGFSDAKVTVEPISSERTNSLMFAGAITDAVTQTNRWYPSDVRISLLK